VGGGEDAIARLARNSLFVFVTRGMEMGGAVLTIAVLTRYLGLELFGWYTWVWAVVLFFQPLVNFELNTILTREVSRDPERTPGLLGAALLIKWVLILVFALSIGLLATSLELTAPVRLALIIALLSEIAFQHSMLFSGVFNGFQRMEYDALLTFLFRATQLGGLLLAVLFRWPFASLFAIILAGNLLRLALGGVFLVRRFLHRRPVLERRLVRYLLGEAALVTVGSTLTSLSFRLDIYLLQWLRDETQVALFHVPHMIVMQLQILPTALVTALFPLLARWRAQEQEKLLGAAHLATKLLLLLGGAIGIATTSFARPMVRLLGGRAFDEAAVSLRILIWCAAILFLNFLATYLLITIHQQRKLIVGAVLSLLVNAALDAWLIPGMGHVGAAIGTVVGYASQIIVVYYFLLRHLEGFRLWSSLLAPLLLTAAAAGAARSLDSLSPFLGAGVGLAALAVAVWRLQLFDSTERRVLAQLLRRRRGPAPP
jgi:O-antigen/teichoic acid export membrane protein